MSRYSQIDEENLRDQSLVLDWSRSDLLDPPQASALQAELQVDLRRLHVVLRAVLFLFTSLIVISSLGLALVLFRINNNGPLAAACALWALLCFALAWFNITKWRLYRCGVEEAFAVAAVVCAAVSVGFIANSMGSRDLTLLLAVVTAASGGFGLYRLFGFRYAALAGVVLSGLAPFALDISPAVERSLAVLILLLIFSVSRNRHTRYLEEIFGDDYQAIQATSWAGIYIVLNQQLSWLGIGGVTGWLYWPTYALIWVHPAAGMWLGIRDRERAMIDVSALAGLVTLVTNKSYLGWTRQTWDPLLFGVLLMGAAVALRRWLAKGTGGEREGFTPLRVLESQDRALARASMVSLAVQAPVIDTPRSEPGEGPGPGGGRSGGAGASGAF